MVGLPNHVLVVPFEACPGSKFDLANGWTSCVLLPLHAPEESCISIFCFAVMPGPTLDSMVRKSLIKFVVFVVRKTFSNVQGVCRDEGASNLIPDCLCATYLGPCRTWIRLCQDLGRSLRGVPFSRGKDVPTRLWRGFGEHRSKMDPAASCRRVSCKVFQGCITFEQYVRPAMPPCLAVATRAPNVQIYVKKNDP